MTNGLDLGNVLFQAERIKGARTQNVAAQQQIDANALLRQRAAQFNPLAQAFLQDPTQANLAAAAQIDPAAAQQLAQTVGAGQGIQQQQFEMDQAEATQTLRAARAVLASKAPKALVLNGFPQFVELSQERGNDINELDDDQVRQMASGIIEQVTPFAGAGLDRTAGQREFASQVAGAGLSADETEQANRIALGLEPRATGAAQKIFDVGGVPHIFDPNSGEAVPVKIRGKEVTTGTVSDSEAAILANKERARGAVVLSNKAIDSGFTAIGKINGNIRNIDRALGALARGAKTGAVTRFFPNIRAASVELGQVQKELGLDIISAVTFGALSKGELDLALSTALPVGLDEAELTDFLTRKKQAQEGLRDYFDEQISFLGTGGTVLEWRQQQQGAQQPPEQPAPQAAGQPQEFATVEEAEAANLPVGTRVSIGGQLGTIQ